jgi:hypothetical protein
MNPFKSQSNRFAEQRNDQRNDQRRNMHHTHNQENRNTFSSNVGTKIKQFLMTDTDFPTLGSIATTKNNIADSSAMNYKTASTFVADEIVEDLTKIVPSGHVRIYKDIDGNIVTEYGEKTEWQRRHEYMEAKKDAYMHSTEHLIRTLIRNWEKNRLRYDELNGEGEYNRVYSMPNFKVGEEFPEDSDDENEYEYVEENENDNEYYMDY